MKPALTDIPPAPAHRWSRLVPWLLLALLMLPAGAMRCYQIGESLWIDELHTAWVVADGLEEIAPRARIGNYSPLYFYLLAGVTRTLGTSEWSLRLLSMVAGLLLVPIAFVVVKQWTGSVTAGLLTGLLVAIDRDMLVFAGEARPYALVQLLGLVHVWLFWRLLHCPRLGYRFGFVAVAVLLFYLHYTAILLPVGELVCYLVMLAWKRSALAYRPRQLLIDLAVLAVCCLPAAEHLREIAARRRNWALFIPPRPALMIFRWDLYLAIPLSWLAATAALRWAMRREAIARLPQNSVLLLVVCWMLVPVAVVWILTLTDIARLSMLRYVVASALAPILFAGLCCALCRGMGARLLVALLIVTAAVSSGGVLKQYRLDGRLVAERNEDWRGAVQLIRKRDSECRRPVLVFSQLVELDEKMYRDPALARYGLLPVTGIYRLDDAGRLLIPLPMTGTVHYTAAQQRALSEAGEAWLLLRANRGIESLVDGLLPGRPTIIERRNFGYVTVVRVKLDL